MQCHLFYSQSKLPQKPVMKVNKGYSDYEFKVLYDDIIHAII